MAQALEDMVGVSTESKVDWKQASGACRTISGGTKLLASPGMAPSISVGGINILGPSAALSASTSLNAASSSSFEAQQSGVQRLTTDGEQTLTVRSDGVR